VLFDGLGKQQCIADKYIVGKNNILLAGFGQYIVERIGEAV
jgi:hypothetical protein